MKAMNWLQERIKDTWKYLSPLLAVGGFIFLFIGSQKQITLIIDGNVEQRSTHARSVGALLREFNLKPGPGDQITPALSDPLEDGQVVVFTTSYPVTLDEEGDLIATRSTASLPENILAATELRLYPGDSLETYGRASGKVASANQHNDYWLRIDRGYPIRLMMGDEILQFSSSASTLGEALWEAGIELHVGDQLEPDASTPIDRSLDVILNRAAEYVFVTDGQSITRRAAGNTVGEILVSAGFSLAGLDYSLPAVDEQPPSEGEIQIIRVVEELLVELEPVEFETEYVPADQLELDTLEVLEPGTFGVRSKTVRIRFEDGEEVSRNIEDAVIAVEPKNRVIGYGTQIVVRSIDTGQGTIEYWRAIPIYATSYSPCNLGVPWCGTLTASGKSVNRGIIGVIRSWYNLMRGWSVYVPGYGPGTFEDIGAGIAGRDWIDLGFTDENFEPWHQWTTLYFLTPVPPLDSIPWILP